MTLILLLFRPKVIVKNECKKELRTGVALLVLILIVAVIQRRSSKKTAVAVASSPGTSSTQTTTPSMTPSPPKTACHRCKTVYRPSDVVQIVERNFTDVIMESLKQQHLQTLNGVRIAAIQ